MQKIKYVPNMLCWAIELKNWQIHYLPFRKHLQADEIGNLPCDPKYFLVGVFIEETDKPKDKGPADRLLKKRSITEQN